MRHRLIALACGIALLAAIPHAATPPKLAVVIVVDQMRADYVDRFNGDWNSGLKKMVDQGAWFRRAAYPYLNTFTCAGHATVGTGAYPVVSGVFQNAWFDRATSNIVTCTDDPNVTAVSYGGTRVDNEGPAHLKVPTFADEMRRQKGAKVVSLSLKARSAIMLAGHGGDAVTWLNESLDGWETSSTYATAPVPQVKAFVDANPIEADLGKVWTLAMPANKYQHPDAGLGEAAPAGWSTRFPHPLNGQGQGRVDAAYYGQWERSPFADAYVGRMAAALVDAFQLGKRDTTDVLLVSFSTPDLVGHAFGPKSVEIQDIYVNLDRTIGQLFDDLDRLVGKGEWVAGLSADHGVTEIPEQLVASMREGGRFDARALVTAVEQELRKSFGNEPAIIRMVGNDIYLRPGLASELAANKGALDAVLEAAQTTGVQRAFLASQLTAPGATTSRDALLRAAALSYVPVRAGDIIVALKPGWMSGSIGTTHGSANQDDQRVPVLFYGAGIKPGRFNDAASPADLVPTLASVVGITLPQAQGKALASALATAPSTARQ
jgi:predicted AlkP superfamily pyrophosphatase or phosphodiesterase